jgi:hypothetical protein
MVAHATKITAPAHKFFAGAQKKTKKIRRAISARRLVAKSCRLVAEWMQSNYSTRPAKESTGGMKGEMRKGQGGTQAASVSHQQCRMDHTAQIKTVTVHGPDAFHIENQGDRHIFRHSCLFENHGFSAEK